VRFVREITERKNPKTNATVTQLLEKYLAQFQGSPNTAALRDAREEPHQATGCGGFVRHRLLASSDTAGHVSVPRMLVCVDTASAHDGCQVVRCFVAWARR
jgi:hypothetical protein